MLKGKRRAANLAIMAEALVPGLLESMRKEKMSQAPSEEIQQMKIEAARVKRERKAAVLAQRIK